MSVHFQEQNNSSRLENPVIKNEFALKLKNRFHVLQDLNNEAETENT